MNGVHLKKLLAGLAGIITIIALSIVPASAQVASNPLCTDVSDLAIIGASDDTGYATTGYNNNDPVQGFQRTLYGWATGFADDAHASWGSTTHNYARNGAQVSDYLPGGRFPLTTGAVADMNTYHPDLVMLDLGGNEYYNQINPAVFANNMATLVDNIRAGSPNTVILLSIYAELQYPGKPTWDWNTYAGIIYNTAVTKGLPLIDMRQVIPYAGSTTRTSPDVWNADKIHLNDAGNRAEKAFWWGWFASIKSVGC